MFSFSSLTETLRVYTTSDCLYIYYFLSQHVAFVDI